MQKISVLLAGIGGFGNFYIKELLHGPGAERFQLAGAVDPYADKNEAVKELRSRGIPVYDTLQEFYQALVRGLYFQP